MAKTSAKPAPKKAAKKTAAKKTAKKSTTVKLGDPQKTAQLIDTTVNDFLLEVANFGRGNKSAGSRARKKAQESIQLFRLVRKEIQNKKNNG